MLERSKRLNEYNLYFDGEFVGTFTESELAKQFNISHEQVREIAKSKKPYKKEWEIHAIYNANKVLDKQTVAVMEEWDMLTEPYRQKQRIAG